MAKNIQRESKFPGLMQDLKPTSTHTHTDTHTPVVKERKTRRVQLLMKESTVDALDAYAKKHDTSRNDIIQNLVEDFIKNNV
jgi:hypothetical protein